MKTLFITSFHPLISRNLLLNDDFMMNLNNITDLRVVIFCPDYKQDYFERNFKKNNIIINGIKNERIDQQDILFNYLNRFLISTSTLSIHRRELLWKHKKILAFAFAYLLIVIGMWAFARKLIRWLDAITISKNRFQEYFDKYKPSVVLSTDLFHVDDVHFLAEAKQRGVITLGMVRSWDNISGKGLFRIKPDKVLVSNHMIKEEVMKHEVVNNQAIEVIGMTQMDFYINHPILASREDFFKKINLDLHKKTILFAPAGKRFYDADWYVAKILKDFITKEYPYAQVLVRCPPNDNVFLENISNDENFVIDYPGQQFKKNIFRDRELDLKDASKLAETLFYIDVVVGYSSTLCIEAAWFDKPIITVAFDDSINKPYLKSARRFLDFTHVRKFNQTQCARIVYNPEALRSSLALYLAHPEIDRSGRRKIIQDQIGRLDGQSGERLALLVKSYLVIT